MRGTPGPARAGFRLAAMWTLVELLIRDVLGIVGVVAFVLLIDRSVVNDYKGYLPGPLFIIMVALLIPTVVTEYLVFRRHPRPDGDSWQNRWGYDFSRKCLVIGVAAGVLWITAVTQVEKVDIFLFHGTDTLTQSLAESGWVGAVLLLIGNALMGPVTEEFAWRGIIQFFFQQAWGFWRAVIITAFLFAAKHIVVDLSFARTTTLIVGALGLCYVGGRWGTAASTAMHLVGNSIATVWGILDAF